MPEMHLSPVFLLLVQAAVIISVARLFGLLARKVHQPVVIAEVLAGVLLGPSVLGAFWPEASHTIFPKESFPLIAAVSEIGLVFFMFVVGLEFDPRLVRGRFGSSLLISNAGIAAPFVLATALAWKIYPSLAPEGVAFLPFGLFMGVAMSITAFPVLARILAERRALKSPVGAITLACAAVADVVAWCILAFVVAIARSSGVTAGLWTTGLTALYIGVMVMVVRPLLERIGQRSREGITQNLVAVVFVAVLASATATELIGIHALFGAFLVGALMPRDVEFSVALTEKVEDFVVVALLPLFFAFSGLRTEIGLLDTPERWMECAVIIAVACVGKFGGTSIAARLTGVRWREAGAIGILMNTRGLMELIVLNIGLDLGIISPTLFTMMVVMALVTTAMTSPLLQLVYPTEELAEDTEPDTAITPPPLPLPVNPVLLCIADPAIGESMATLAAALYRGRPTAVLALRLLPAERITTYLRADPNEEEVEPLLTVQERGHALGIEIGALSFVSARPSADILRVVDDQEAGLVLLGFHRPLLTRTALGGVVKDVLASSTAPVGVLVDRGLEKVSRILVTLEDSPDGHAARAVAERIGAAPGVTLTGFRVIAPNAPVESRPDDLIRTLIVPTDKPTQALLAEAAEGYDLVIVALGEAWDLSPTLNPLHTEQLVAKVPVSLLAVKAAAT